MPSKQPNKMPVAGVTSIALAAAALLFTGELPYLETRAPQKQNLTYELRTPLEQVDARLWQDPFGAIAEFERKEGARAKSDADAERDEAVHGRRYVQPPTAAAASRFRWFRYGKGIHDVQVAIGRVTSSSDSSGTATAPLKILAVTMVGSPYVGGEESRRRERYAVVSALGAQHFAPVDNEHIGYAVLHFDASGKLVDDVGADDPEQDTVSVLMPFETFTTDSRRPRVASNDLLLLWIDDAAFAAVMPQRNWLQAFRDLIRILAPCPDNDTQAANCAQVRIVGPSSSDQYLAITEPPNQVTVKRDNSLDNRLLVVSPFVTSDIISNLPSVRFIRTIPTDETVLGKLAAELPRRDAQICGGPGTVILLSEWDTEYGRRARETLEQALKGKDSCGKAQWEYVRSYSFVRGLDGAVVGTDPLEPAAHHSAAPDDTAPRPHTKIEWPETSDQRDYIRRLGERIADLEKSKELDRLKDHRPRSPGIRAVGIIASDTDDKLMLLQALRQKFPDVTFFTTDADARLFNPRVQKWTRNMLVASGFGLTLRDELQYKTPPFRDVYQTSAYLATLVALQDDSIDALKAAVKLWAGDSETPGGGELFEVGTSKLVRLTQPEDAMPVGPCAVESLVGCASVVERHEVDLPSPQQRTVVLALVVVVVATIAGFAAWNYRHVAARTNASKGLRWLAWALLGMLGIVLLGTVLIACVAANVAVPLLRSNEPATLTQGVSSAPVALCWSLALSAIFFYLLVIVTTIPRRFAELEKSFLGPSTALPAMDPNDRRRHFWFWMWCELRDRNAPSFVGTKADNFVDTWALYKHHTFDRRRLLRIVVWYAVMLVPMVMLRPWLPPLIFPISGTMRLVLHLLGMFGFGALMLLMAVVADTVLLCMIFVIAIGRRRNTYPAPIVAAAAARYELLPDLEQDADSLLDTELISMRTSMVADYLYYPFVVMAILALGLFATLEDWARWPGRFVVLGLSVCELGALWVLLRWSAERARRNALEKLETAQLRACREHARRPVLLRAVVRQCRLLSEHISRVRDGAFAALQDQPIVRALLLPIGGAGAAQLLQYFSFHFP
jgi:hypothetical protein